MKTVYVIYIPSHQGSQGSVIRSLRVIIILPLTGSVDWELIRDTVM